MRTKKSILHITRFKPIPFHGGGSHRTLQIYEILTQAEYDVKCSDWSEYKYDKLKYYLHGLSIWSKYKFKFIPNFRSIGAWGFHHLSLCNVFESHTGEKIVLWEWTADQLIPDIAKQYNYRVIALPQNLESLVRSYNDNFDIENILKRFKNEVLNLKKADLVVCISREEQWLLKLLGINADFLPYYPPSAILKQLLKVRNNRVTRKKINFLIIGTAANPPTLAGMIEQISILQDLQNFYDFEVDIVGYHTDKLLNFFPNLKGIRILGGVKQEYLFDLMKKTPAILIHQNAGVGALTRISEILTAGIPIIANSNACRSAFHYQGIYCYDSKDELLELMKSTLSSPPVPTKHQSLENLFQQKVRDFLI